MMTILTVLHVIAVCTLALWLIHEILENAKLRVKNAKMRAALEEIKRLAEDPLDVDVWQIGYEAEKALEGT